MITPKPAHTRLALGLLLCLGAATVYAKDGNVFELTLSQDILYDDNIYRLAPDANTFSRIGTERRDDLSSTTGIRLTADKTLGRQNLYGNVRHAITRYQIHKSANYDLDDGQLGWRGKFGANNGWDAYYKRSAVQTDYTDNLAYTANQANTDVLHLGTEIRYLTDWRTELAIDDERQRNSSALRNSGDYNGRSALIGFGYWPPTSNGLGVQFRHAQRDYPLSRGWRQNDLGLYGSYAHTPDSKFSGNVGVQIQDVTGGSNTRRGRASLSHTWSPKGSSTYSLRLLREKETPESYSPVMAEVYGGVATWSWIPRAKLRFDSTIDYRKRHYDPQIEAGTGQALDRREIYRAAMLSSTWLPDPAWQIQLIVRNEKRNANHIRYSYDRQNYSLNTQYVY